MPIHMLNDYPKLLLSKVFPVRMNYEMKLLIWSNGWKRYEWSKSNVIKLYFIFSKKFSY